MDEFLKSKVGKFLIALFFTIVGVTALVIGLTLCWAFIKMFLQMASWIELPSYAKIFN